VPRPDLYPAAARRFPTSKSTLKACVLVQSGKRYHHPSPFFSRPEKAPACCSTVGANLSGWRPERLIGATPCLLDQVHSPIRRAVVPVLEINMLLSLLQQLQQFSRTRAGTDALVAFCQVPSLPRLSSLYPPSFSSPSSLLPPSSLSSVSSSPSLSSGVICDFMSSARAPGSSHCSPEWKYSCRLCKADIQPRCPDSKI
jgi:hypothetical protein